MATDAPDPSDDAIDQALRRVSVSRAIRGRMTPAQLFPDAALDRMLTAVVVPGGLVDRVRAGLADPAHANRGIDLDHVSNVVNRGPWPAEIVTPRYARSAPAWWRGVHRSVMSFVRDVSAVAAAIVVMAGMFAAGMGLSEWLARTGEPQPARRWPGGRETAGTDAPRSSTRDRAPQADTVARADAPRGKPSNPSSASAVASAPEGESADGPDIVERRAAAHSLTVRGALDVTSRSGGDLGMRGAAVAAVTRRRVPRDRGFDLAFEIQHGESPFIDPSAHVSLVNDTPPLTTRTDSFDAALEALRSGRKLPAGMVRAEHVVAAMSAPDVVGAEAAEPQPALSLYGVRSLRTAPPSVLVEVAVTAPPIHRQDVAPLAATIVLDRSAAAGTPPAWQSICRGVESVAALMRPADRVTVIVAASRPLVVVDRGDAAALEEASRLLAAMPIDSGVDLDAAIRLALAADGGRARQSCVVVSCRDSLERSRDDAAAAFAAWQRGAVGEAVGDDADEAHSPAFVLVSGASWNVPDDGPGSRGDVGRDSAAIRRGLVEAVFRGSAVVVRDCRVTVSMNPSVVASYRLIGHRHSAVDSVSPGEVPAVDLVAGETARAVYEVVMKATAAAGAAKATPPWMVRAALEGRLPGDRSATQVSAQAVLSAGAIEPASPLPSPRGCEIILAAEVGELLAASVHAAPARRDARAVTALARAWRERGDITSFGADVLACLERPRVGLRSNPAAFDGR